MLKKFNVFALALLIIGQTILGPIGTSVAFADEQDESEAISDDVFTQSEADASDASSTEEVSVNKDALKTLLDNKKAVDDYEEASYAAYLQAVDKGQGVYDNPDATQDDVNDAVDKIERAITALQQKTSTSTEGENQNLAVDSSPVEGQVFQAAAGEDDEEPGFDVLAASQEIEGATLTGFKMTIGGQEVGAGAFSQELEQNAVANFEVAFSVPMEDGDGEAWGDGSSFKFELPKSLIDFDGAFQGGKTVDGITYTYTTEDNVVKVVLSGMKAEQASNTPATLTINFSSGFTLFGDDVNQDLVIPAAGGGTDEITATFTFKPTSSTEKVKKTKIGTPTPGADGNHVMDWEVWVNEAGKQLTDAELTDSATGGHAIVPGSVNVYQYTVGLSGVQNPDGSGNQVVTDANWTAINGALTDTYAYKITYKTAVNLVDDERDGSKNFNNTVTFKNEGQPNETSINAQHTITYGKALEKHDGTGNNYAKNWRIDYNHNLLSIPANQAVLEDTISGPHEIDFESIQVYKMNDADGNVVSEVSAGTEITTGFSINNTTGFGDSFKITFNTPISDAYTVVYKSKYNTKDFIENVDITGQTLSNTVESGSGKNNTGNYSLSENLLTKSRSVDFDDKVITWTIKITSDNPEKSISDLKLTDTFQHGSYNGEHTLVDNSITVSGTSDQNYNIDAESETTDGFEITGINVAAGQTATVTYKTKFAIGDKGTVQEQGYGNTAKTEWESDSVRYEKTKTAFYKPESTTVNNGKKDGKFNYETREFTWEVRVNINLKDIAGAILVDTVRDGHKYVEGSIDVLPLTGLGGSDTGGTIGTDPIAEANYSVTEASDDGFKLTFNDPLNLDLNKKAYVVRYKTVDEDKIIGIGSNNADANPEYVNGATFTTKGDQTFTLVDASVALDSNVANNLIDKQILNQNQNNNEKITWKLDVNKSHSDLGTGIKLTDLPGDNQWLLEDSIKIAPYNVSESGISNSNDWKSVSEASGVSVEFDKEGGFTLTFDSLENVGYQVRYETIGFGSSGDPLKNTATLHYSGETADNQKTKEEFSGNMSFSSSESTFTSTRGSAKFKKVGIDSVTGEVKDEQLEGVEFQLVRKTTNNEYIIKTDTTDENGEITFKNVPYNDYHVREVAAPTDYTKMNDFEFTLDATTTLDLNPGLAPTVLVNTTPLPAGSCDVFTITVKDVDGELITSDKVILKDQNGKETELNSDHNGEVRLPSNFPAGEYEVTHEEEGLLGNVIVKYSDNCEDEVQPAPSCEFFTVTIKGEKDADGNDTFRENVELTLKYEDNTVADITVTTDGNGLFELPSDSTKAGKYTVYEGQQFLGVITVTYKDGCEDELVQAPKCEVFTLTVKDVDGEPREEGTVVTIKVKDDENDAGVTKTTNADGKVELNDLEPNEYEVYENNTLIGEFSTTTDCETFVQPAPKCELFTVTINNESGDARPNVTVTVKDKFGNDIATSKTDEHGKIKVQSGDLPAGKYDVYEGGIFLGEITVSYIDETCEAVLDTDVENAGSCPLFTLTVNDRSNNPREDVTIVVKDAEGNAVEGVDANGDPITTFETNEDGQVTFGYVIKPGTYTVYEVDANDREVRINSFTVVDTCEATVKPRSTGGGGGGIPPTPEDPDPENPDPTDPENPDPENPDPEEPVDPTDPENPDPEEPVDPTDPIDPENPNPNPDPTDPKNPDDNGSDTPKGEDEPGDKNGTDTDPPAGNGGGDGTGTGTGTKTPSVNDSNNVKNSNGTGGDKLPQTGEEQYMYMIALGTLLLAAGASVLYRQRRKA